MTENQNREQVVTNTAGYNAPNVLNLRLNTEPELKKIEKYLSGQELFLQPDANGQPQTVIVQVGEAKLNREGVDQVLSFVSAVFNSQNVQGNFDEIRYDNYIEEFNINLVAMLVENARDFKLKDEHIQPICDFIMSLIIPFMTRTLFNKERDSYATSLQSRENTTQTSKGGIPFFGN